MDWASALIAGCCLSNWDGLTITCLSAMSFTPAVNTPIGMPREEDTTEAVFASGISVWNIESKALRRRGEGVPDG